MDWNMSICAVPFPFKDADGIRQRNAINSWLLLKPKPEVILLGDDEGVAEYAETHGLRHVGRIRKNEHGDMDCADLFAKLQQAASFPTILYADCDIMLLSNFPAILRRVSEKYKTYMMVGGRWSIPTPASDLDFTDPKWEEKALAQVTRHHEHGTDYYAFPRGFVRDMPTFSMGAGTWDGWFMWYALHRKAELVRADFVTKTLHQDHGPRFKTRPGKPYNKDLCKNKVLWVDSATVTLR
jgi:hypothetical protein